MLRSNTGILRWVLPWAFTLCTVLGTSATTEFATSGGLQRYRRLGEAANPGPRMGSDRPFTVVTQNVTSMPPHIEDMDFFAGDAVLAAQCTHHTCIAQPGPESRLRSGGWMPAWGKGEHITKALEPAKAGTTFKTDQRSTEQADCVKCFDYLLYPSVLSLWENMDMPNDTVRSGAPGITRCSAASASRPTTARNGTGTTEVSKATRGL